MKFGKSSEILSGYRRGIIQVYWKSLSDGFPLLFFVRNAIIKGIVRRAGVRRREILDFLAGLPAFHNRRHMFCV